MKGRILFNMCVLFLVIILVATACAGDGQSALERKIRRVENGLIGSYDDPPWAGMALGERMDHYNVPGVSIAVINDFEVEWARGYGVLAAGSNVQVTPETLFQPASITKPVVAVAALHFVAEGQLALDEDVNQVLVSWQVPENRWTAQEKVTLRRLLSHTAGVTVHGFRGYAQGEAVPNLQQILDGVPPANSPPIRVDMMPGTEHRYSGGGYMIVQQLLEDVTGRAFPDIMQEVVLEPWGMADTTFASPLPAHLEDRAAAGHRENGAMIPGGWHTYPEMGAGGSPWSTPTDMALFMIAMMKAYNGEGDEVLSPEMAGLMLTPQTGNVGLGVFVEDDGGDRFYFLHDGANDGYESYMVGYPQRGQGVVIMTNSDGGEALWREIVNSVSVEYGLVPPNWGFTVGIVVVVVLALAGAGIMVIYRRRHAG